MTVHQTVPLLFVSDLEESRIFYCDRLGFEISDKWELEGKLAWCWLKLGGAALMLQQACESDPPSSETGKGVTFYFLCKDADTVYREITQRGVEATKPAVAFYGMKQTFVADPDGYLLCFENRVDTSTPGR